MRPLRVVRVYSRNAENRSAFADRARADLALDATAVNSAEDAVAGADLVIVATRSQTPVLDAAAIEPGAHVVTVGPKFASAHELPLELADRASVITSDSPEQAASYPDRYPLFLAGTPLFSLNEKWPGLVAARSGQYRPEGAVMT